MQNKILAILAVGLMSLFLSTQAHAWGTSKDKDSSSYKSQSSSGMTDKGDFQSQNKSLDQNDMGDYDSSQMNKDSLNDTDNLNQKSMTENSTPQKFDQSNKSSTHGY